MAQVHTEEINLDDGGLGEVEVTLAEFHMSRKSSPDLVVVGEKNCDKIGHNNNTICPPQSHASSRASSPTQSASAVCPKCQKTEGDAQAMLTLVKNQFETEMTRLRKEVESATKTKESVVMKYATGEVEVLKLKRSVENSERLIKQLNSDMEVATRKQKMLSSERERLAGMIDAKFHEIEGLQKDITRLNQEISSRDFKITWAQNKLREETEAHNNTKESLESRIEEIESQLQEYQSQSQIIRINGQVDSNENNKYENGFKSETYTESTSNEQENLELNIAFNEIEDFKVKNKHLLEENSSLVFKIQALENERSIIEAKMTRLKESNSEHLHQIATLQSDLAATEYLKIQLQKEKDLAHVLENECQSLRQAHADILNDMAICREKEVELLAYTQQVTEKNVALQSEYSSLETKSNVHKDENERLHRQIVQLESDIHSMEHLMTEDCKNRVEVQQSVETDVLNSKKIISDLQVQLDEARGEIGLLNRKLNSSVRELSKELYVARKQVVKDGHSGLDGLSQSSRTSSSSSLTNGDCSAPPHPPSVKFIKQEESPTHCNGNEQDCPVIPDQQVLIERIVKLQRNLAKKQDKLEFLQEHVKQLVESVQRKSKIIQTYAMSQDVEALSSNLAEQNKLNVDSTYGAEILKHKGIMASVYGSKPADDAMTLDLSLEINRKLQVVLEDTLLRNITLKDSLNTLGKEISKLTESNQDLSDRLSQLSK